MSYRSNSTSFTLTGLLIIIILPATTANFTTPSFKQLAGHNELQSATGKLNAILQYVHSEAVPQRRTIIIQALKDKDRGRGLGIGVLASGLTAVPLRKHDGFCVVTLIAREKSVVEHLTSMANGALVSPMEWTFATYQSGKTGGGRTLSISQAGRIQLEPSSKAPQSCY